jgi:hypothetical protein
MTVTAYPRAPQADGTALLVYAGPPNVAVEWELTGPGTLTPQDLCTDARGVAGALFTPNAAGDVVTVTVTHGTEG